MQYGFGGSRALDAEPNEIPRVGPQWLLEGSAEYAAYRATASQGLIGMDEIRAQWASRTKLISNPLSSKETSQGFFAEPEAYQIGPPAVDFLLGGRPDALLVAFYEAIGRGQPWQSAFASVSGKSIETFYAEFEAYRAGL